MSRTHTHPAHFSEWISHAPSQLIPCFSHNDWPIFFCQSITVQWCCLNCNLFLDKYPISHTKTWHIFLIFFRPTFTYCLMCVPVSGPSYELHSASNIITNSGRLWDPNWKTSMAVLKLKLTQLQKSASKNLEHPHQNLKSCRIHEKQN